jgi:hypothetical protein
MEAKGTADTALSEASTAVTNSNKAIGDAATAQAAADAVAADLAAHLQTLHIGAIACPDGQVLSGIIVLQVSDSLKNFFDAIRQGVEVVYNHPDFSLQGSPEFLYGIQIRRI